MRIKINADLRRICAQILEHHLSHEAWRQIESDDMFQAGAFVGGYDATEAAFTFSYFDADGAEHWFQLTAENVAQIAGGVTPEIIARPAQ